MWRGRRLQKRRCESIAANVFSISRTRIITDPGTTEVPSIMISGESTRVPPMWLGFDSRTRRHMWVDVQLLLVLSSAPSGSVFSGYSGFRVSSKTNILKFQFYLERTDTFERVLLSCSLFRGYKKITLSYIQYIFALYTGKAVAIVKSCNEVETYWILRRERLCYVAFDANTRSNLGTSAIIIIFLFLFFHSLATIHIWVFCSIAFAKFWMPCKQYFATCNKLNQSDMWQKVISTSST